MAEGFPQANAVPGEPLPGRRLGNRFELLQRLKAGRGISTWLGSDLRTGSRVVVKVASTSSMAPTARQRLEHEATVLSGHQRRGALNVFGRLFGGLQIVVVGEVPAPTAERFAQGVELPGGG